MLVSISLGRWKHLSIGWIAIYEAKFNGTSPNSNRAHQHRRSCIYALGTSHREPERACQGVWDYFKVPFLAYAYLAAIPFFIALCQAFKALGYLRRDKTFSQASVKAFADDKILRVSHYWFVAVSVIFIVFGTKMTAQRGFSWESSLPSLRSSSPPRQPSLNEFYRMRSPW